MGVLIIRTADFKLAYRLMKALRRRGIEFLQVSENSPLPHDASVWLGTPEEVFASKVGNGIPCTLDDVAVSIDRALYLSTLKDPTIILAFGIDPGPRPGLAWNSDGKPLGTEQMEDVDDTIDRICQLVKSIPHAIAVIRIGDGSPTIGSRLANICLARGLRVEMVDERRTSTGVGRNEHHAAAARIAQIIGEEVTSKRKVQPSTGEVREVQRKSRSESGGKLTLPNELAQAVAVGRLSMVEAFDEYERRRGSLI
ncbi:MAG TPA: hypothetical protein EYN58_05770 [Candidatus Poseidoniales archaeon]|nr:MAG: hypothetical protein CXX81_22915 [Euryarchaeota archaeon]HHZ74666.1 hypothetical protein [Candidatus Poseidoniales archaeon]PXY76378.1 MAG: hypothetical protein CXX81_15085 [Euryarchaeota archaeon]PXY77544.1 MAG: hypothetical protein CXX80_00540 [Euryarchaeota archaeon]PXY78180.1 MAG: hypothetical protein CXX81_09065 [Euryarchaeota archaeon]